MGICPIGICPMGPRGGGPGGIHPPGEPGTGAPPCPAGGGGGENAPRGSTGPCPGGNGCVIRRPQVGKSRTSETSRDYIAARVVRHEPRRLYQNCNVKTLFEREQQWDRKAIADQERGFVQSCARTAEDWNISVSWTILASSGMRRIRMDSDEDRTITTGDRDSRCAVICDSLDRPIAFIGLLNRQPVLQL